MKNIIRLLLVDDDPDDRMLFLDAVEEIDNTIACTIATDGQQALEMLKNVKYPLPDFIFLDIRMPRVNGKNCLYEIKRDERLRHLPVIIYTTSRGVEESKELQKMGAYHFISKPFDAKEIYYLISFVLEELGTAPGNNNN